ncbi:phosphoribosyltransferase family protein [Adonisia turfae]|uniref:phosphoribosyltransferase family protein n=1 Tax=Adonisia turfae TaxID=2950184 RepID=UPI0013D26B42
MLNVCHLTDDFCIGSYLQKDYWSDDDYPDDRYTAFILEIKNCHQESIQEAIKLFSDCLSGFDAVAVVPSHHVNGQLSGIRQIALGLAHRSQKQDATACLRRHRPIHKLSEDGERSIGVHLQSIELDHANLIKGKRVLLLDDVRSTGHSLAACQQILKAAKPKSVHPLALGQSYGPSGSDPEKNYCHVDIAIQDEYQQQIDACDSPGTDDEAAIEAHLERVENIEIAADLERKTLDQLRLFAGV